MSLFAIGDVQGCWRALRTLLRRIDFERSRDRLWLVGDLVNRGPASGDILRYLMELGDPVTVVLGNHDLHFIWLGGFGEDRTECLCISIRQRTPRHITAVI